MIQLICEGSCLYTPRSAIAEPGLLEIYSGNPILMRLYDEGDCDTIKWPDYSAESLRAALYDDRETGTIPADTKSVLLPDGKEFAIDEICREWTPMIREYGEETKSCKFCGLNKYNHAK